MEDNAIPACGEVGTERLNTRMRGLIERVGIGAQDVDIGCGELAILGFLGEWFASDISPTARLIGLLGLPDTEAIIGKETTATEVDTQGHSGGYRQRQHLAQCICRMLPYTIRTQDGLIVKLGQFGSAIGRNEAFAVVVWECAEACFGMEVVEVPHRTARQIG